MRRLFAQKKKKKNAHELCARNMQVARVGKRFYPRPSRVMTKKRDWDEHESCYIKQEFQEITKDSSD